ncbi:GGDEF domain-containing protein [Colwellia echini]|uniref:diguanylate cyclase n=1 Tax=Colwellia echini TaxID=1982103 RepID=A0ABY3MUU9_9GAMM|nr:GGDEF domain-containing protein [Colwellia echini]TYK64996.1 GGDEF domain-containing protein [Colwellia echini]
MLHYKYLHRSAFTSDALWLLGINAVFFICFIYFDTFEWLVGFVDAHEYLELDELLPLAATLTLSLGIFTYRRLVELSQVTKAFEELSKRNPLTYALNRRAGQAILHRRYSKAIQTGEGFSLLQLNLDNFKRINDAYGPSVGDELLISLVVIIQKNIPDKVKLIHWHSDNFILVLPNDIQSPFELANNLREIIANQLFTTDTITCSMGLATWQKGLTLQDLLHNLEDALFDAKAANKNTVKIA